MVVVEKDLGQVSSPLLRKVWFTSKVGITKPQDELLSFFFFGTGSGAIE